MRFAVCFLCIWSSINIFTWTDIFPVNETDKINNNSQLQQVVNLYIEKFLELEEAD